MLYSEWQQTTHTPHTSLVTLKARVYKLSGILLYRLFSSAPAGQTVRLPQDVP